jgi:two-component system, cell cycle sensor histidine kinase and response regulator CckA
VTDITPTSLTGAELGLDLWRSLADAIPDMLLLVDRKGEILYINHTPPGVALGEVLGRSALDYIPPGSRSELRDSLRQIFATGGTRWREQRVIHPDGSERWYATHSGPVLLNGEVSAAIIIARDITDSKRGQFALAESEGKYRTLVEYAPEAIVVFDVDACRFVEVNQNACTLFGLCREALLETNPIALSPVAQLDGRPSDQAAWDYLNAALAGEVPSFEWLHRTSAGADIECEVRLVKMPSMDRRLVRGSITDVTQQKRLEQQIRQWQKMDALGQLAGGIAHDFNNVLTMVLASAEMLVTDLTDDAQRADARAIVMAARKGAALTSHLLSFARRQTCAVNRVLDLNDVVSEIATMITRVLGDNITLLLQLDPGGAPARIDRSEAEQITMNLLLNARDAIVGPGTIQVTTARGQGGSHFSLLRVRDTGAGIDPAVKHRIFEPFFTTKAEKGSGLGLSTVYGIVSQAGGTLEVESAVGLGTTMNVMLRGE